ncbi:hypothetical protein scyTo_0016755 [Scyliorhinus torazame]|uniref:Uncharacterized protein n=1 Tax=Scyliorhinus torazame TaxID=75743 RepID=A0A401PXI3_SCYTO|nr:hypothetical protein [Scyliorhinus torazame]
MTLRLAAERISLLTGKTGIQNRKALQSSLKAKPCTNMNCSCEVHEGIKVFQLVLYIPAFIVGLILNLIM